MLDSDWSRKILLRSDWSVPKGASITTNDKVICELSNSDHWHHPRDLQPRHGWTYRGAEVIEFKVVS